MIAQNSLPFIFILAIVYLIRKMIKYFEIKKLTKIEFTKMKEKGYVYCSSQETIIDSIFGMILIMAVSMFRVNFNIQYLYMDAGLALGAIALGELITSSFKFRMFYSNGIFIYRGQTYELNQIKNLGFSKFILRPGQIVFQDGKSIIMFKKGLDSLHQLIINQTPSDCDVENREEIK